MRKRVIIVGATGSIGRQALDVVSSRDELFEVVGLSAHRDLAGLRTAATAHPGAALCLSGLAGPCDGIRFTGSAGLEELVSKLDADIVVNGAAGAAGLRPSIAALSSGKDLALANKESVVMGWPLLEAVARETGAKVLPVDSEHAALFQLLAGREADDVEEITITASGGAFRDRPLAELAFVSPDEAAAHPNWNMGRKITIDSATMANKGLEVIEASRLYGFDPSGIRVLIHPQSLVHALVRTADGSLYAQLSEPDMRVPIQNALSWPDCLPCPFGRLDLAGRTLEFREPSRERYPLLFLAYACLNSGDGGPIAYNAADEVAVAAFEAGRIGYLDMARIVASVLDTAWPSRVADIESIFEVDERARSRADAFVREIEC